MEKEPYGPSLAAVRGFLARVGLEKRENLPEPEDHVACEFEVMGRLIARQDVATDQSQEEERWLHLQGEFFKTHLLPWAFLLCQDLENQESADFYRGIGRLTRGFMALEQEVLADWGPAIPKREPLADRRERWGGPTFDPLRIEKGGGGVPQKNP
jgi:TorA maturation chaperone TorD